MDVKHYFIFAVQALCKLAVCFFSLCCCVLFSPFSCPQISPAKAMQDSPFRIWPLPPRLPSQKRKSAGLVRMGGNLWGFMHSFARPVRRVYNHQKDINH